ncbi:MAG: XRE family transcriptional regulator [Acinetobacter sp.]|nr:XRE family transcriptional regulator [Acinetobacter sp.]
MKTIPISELYAQLSPEHQQDVQRMSEELLIEYQLNQIREELNISQKQLADMMGVKQPTISDLEARGDNIKLSTLKRYIEAMGGKLRLDIELPTGKHVGFNI